VLESVAFSSSRPVPLHGFFLHPDKGLLLWQLPAGDVPGSLLSQAIKNGEDVVVAALDRTE